MENEEDTFKRLQQELAAMDAQKRKNKMLVEKSEYDFLKSVLKDKEDKQKRKYRATVYTVITVGAFFMNSAFGVMVALVFIADIFFNFLKLDK